MKRTVRSLKEAQTPLLRKIQSIGSQLQPIENQMKDKVWRTSPILFISPNRHNIQDQHNNDNFVTVIQPV